jgi:hypothetical protein
LAKILDSGQRRKFTTGSVRDVRRGKGRYDLMPPHAEDVLAKHFEKGAEKYGDRNWEKGQPQGDFFDSARRHLNKFARGLDDEDHLVAALWNVMCLVDQRERIKLGLLDPALNDFPPERKRFDMSKTIAIDVDGFLCDKLEDDPTQFGEANESVKACMEAWRQDGWKLVVFGRRLNFEVTGLDEDVSILIMQEWLDEQGVKYDDISPRMPVADAYVGANFVPAGAPANMLIDMHVLASSKAIPA